MRGERAASPWHGRLPPSGDQSHGSPGPRLSSRAREPPGAGEALEVVSVEAREEGIGHGVGLLAVVVPCTVGAIITLVLARPIVVLGPGYEAAVPVLRILVLILPVGALNGSLAVGWLLPNRLDRTITRPVLVGGVLNLVLAPIAASLSGPRGMAVAVLVAESTVMLLLLAALRRRGIFAAPEASPPAPA